MSSRFDLLLGVWLLFAMMVMGMVVVGMALSYII
jgi:hypothetical protein